MPSTLSVPTASCWAPSFPYEDGDTFVRAVEYIIDGTGTAEAHASLDANATALFRIND